MEKTFEGKIISKGIGEGQVLIFRRKNELIRRRVVDDPEEELQRFSAAVEKTMNDLLEVQKKAKEEFGKSGALIFSSVALILKDPAFIDAVKEIIKKQSVNSEYALATVSDGFLRMFSKMQDEYMRARYADVKEVSERVISNLSGAKEIEVPCSGPFILVAASIVPGDLMRLKDAGLSGIVTKMGSVYSHTAILARTMGLPAVTGIDLRAYEVKKIEGTFDSIDGHPAIVDGNLGKLITDPSRRTLSSYERKKKALLGQEQRLLSLRGLSNETLDGKKIDLLSNVNSLSDVSNALSADAGGIGLLRSEFLYLEKDHYPSEEELFINYRRAAEMMGSRPVVIRTLDIGADKETAYFGLPGEENPALGLRGIRFSLQHPQTLRTQLRAIYRASNYGSVSILYPMITAKFEIEEIKRIEAQVKKELKDEGSPFSDEVKRGFMIETPAAVIMSDDISANADFLSIGTNDLTQYMMVCDRNNDAVALWGNTKSPAVMRAIEHVVKNAKEKGVRVSICGEAAEDLTLTEDFIRMGVDSLSVSPSMILPLREHIRNMEISD